MPRRPPKTSSLGRLLELGGLAVRAGTSTAASFVSSLGRPAAAREALQLEELVRNARRLVATLGEMKGAAMKVGQMLSLQDALLPPEVAAVLRSLQKETPSLPLEMVEDQLAEELGDPLQLFASFEPEAFAAASIGQVHRAVLRDGRQVAVKIQYPGIDRMVEADLGNLRRVLKSVVALVSKVDFEPIWQELRARLREELDYLHEAERMRRMAELHAGVPEIVIPRVVEEASTGRILTTEYEEGLSPDEACSPETPQRLKDGWGVVLFDFLLRGLLEHRLLHADPNLANFSFRRDGRVVVYDFGCVKEVPLRLARGYRGLCRAALEGRTDDLPGVLKRMGMHRLDGAPLEERLVTPWAALVLDLLRPSPPYRFGSDDSVARRLVDAARGSLAEAGDVRFPRDIVFVNRTVLGHFGNLARLRAEGPWRDILGRFTESA
ncbi:MAG: AarF/ABC1/UbiB kinase family protein [Thermoanaerobaculia bacterium]|nr:AarF/ABC1/UbiB kinase family protein [Thermoanaerobaculia bacterium]